MINGRGLECEVRAGGVSGRGWLSGLQSHKTRTVLTSPLFTEWSAQPRGSWLENNKCCYWWLGSKQDIANACPSLSNYCSLWAPDSDKTIATPYFHWPVHLPALFSVLLNWEKKKKRAIWKYVNEWQTACQSVSPHYIATNSKSHLLFYISRIGETQKGSGCTI